MPRTLAAVLVLLTLSIGSVAEARKLFQRRWVPKTVKGWSARAYLLNHDQVFAARFRERLPVEMEGVKIHRKHGRIVLAASGMALYAWTLGIAILHPESARWVVPGLAAVEAVRFGAWEKSISCLAKRYAAKRAASSVQSDTELAQAARAVLVGQ